MYNDPFSIELRFFCTRFTFSRLHIGASDPPTPSLSLSEKRSLAIEERRGRCNDRDSYVYLTSKIAAAFKVRPCTLHYAFVHGQDAHMRAACAFKPRTDPRRPFIFLEGAVSLPTLCRWLPIDRNLKDGYLNFYRKFTEFYVRREIVWKL